MRHALWIAILAGAAFGQTMTEFGAAAGVGTVAGANGKNVGDGLTAVFGKINGQAVKAAGKADTPPPALELAPAQPKSDDGGVPLPPGTVRRAAPQPGLPVFAQIPVPAQATQLPDLAEAVPALPPPPEMSPEKLKSVSAGMSRVDLLRLGMPASKIVMDEDGQLVEIYSYRQNQQRIGTVRLSNGAVASVE